MTARVPFIADADLTIYVGDALEVLRDLAAGSVDCIVTSPPYWGLRDYGVTGQLGLEASPIEYVDALVEVLEEAKRVLADVGTLWLNLGDSYSSNPKGAGGDDKSTISPSGTRVQRETHLTAGRVPGLPVKNLVGVPWRVAFALQGAGWYLRSDIIWSKPNPMPASVLDRPTSAHEYIFLLSKQARYHYDAAAIAEPARWFGPNGKPKAGPHAGQMHARAGKQAAAAAAAAAAGNDASARTYDGFNARYEPGLTRNKRDVWEVQTVQYAEVHFATFPPALIEPCILAGCPAGGVVLDPFAGSGTTGYVARQHGRRSVLIELSPEYARLAAERCQQLSLLAEAVA